MATLRQFAYAAEDERGAVKNGVIEANDVNEAARRLKAERLRPISVEPARQGLSARLSSRTNNATLSLSDLAQISRRMSDLLRAELPAAHALRLGAGQARSDKEKAFLSRLYEEARAGASLTEAVKKSGFNAPRLFTALIEAGENLGALAPQFDALAAHCEEALALRREIVSQLIYPAALVVLIFVTLIFLSFLVLPQFEAIFQTTEAKPPPETQFVLEAGRLLRRYWALGPVAAILAFAGVRTAAKRNPRLVERAALSLPFAGSLLQTREAGAFFRTLATLLTGGMPLARAMPLAIATVRFAEMRGELERAELSVRTGERLGPALARARYIPKELVSFIEIGDETGALAAMAGQAARLAETRVKTAVKSAMILLAPVLTALMGLLTACVIAAVMSGVLSLNEAVY